MLRNDFVRFVSSARKCDVDFVGDSTALHADVIAEVEEGVLLFF